MGVLRSWPDGAIVLRWGDRVSRLYLLLRGTHADRDDGG
jgi:hypothetical protein